MSSFISPVFNERISHKWTSRKLMGLPETFVRSQHDIGLNMAFRDLLVIDPEHWPELVEDPKQDLYLRLVAGNALALYGDSRVLPFDPIMITISPENPVTLGLAFEQVDYIYEQYRTLGVQRSWIEKECPFYQINLPGFRIAKYPVTNYEFSIFLEETELPDIPTSWPFGRFPIEKANHPVFSITPETAVLYADWLAKKTGRPFRLPSEAEWEFAAGGAHYEFPWGNEFIAGIVNTSELGLMNSSPVGCFPVGNSIYGVADMAGNVEEYVLNTYSPYPGGKLIMDDLYDICPNYRIARGGSFARFRDLARSKRRHGWNPESEVYVMGFRLAEDI